MTTSSCGLCSTEDPSENGAVDDIIDVIDGSTDSIVDRFADITIIDRDGASDSGSISSSNSNAESRPFSRPVEATHIIVLVHGWMGNPAEMGYIRESIQNAVVANAECSTVNHRFVIHSASCNCEKTDDGIAVGGSRLAQEINELVQYVIEGEQQGDGNNGSAGESTSEGSVPSHKFTFSIVGNSLGGLYARHALAGIDWVIGDSESSISPIVLIPMVFVTTATPHLGISQHTYVPLPRAAEFVVAQGMKETGRDFFQFTPVLEDLFCKDYFINPLASFQKRIAYINVYGTDFQVPTATAAFWAVDSDSPHYRVKHSSEDNDIDAESTSFDSESISTPSIPKAIVMTLTTPRCLEPKMEGGDLGEEKKGEEGDSEEAEKKTVGEGLFASWSKRLDRLGWTKVLVDVREDVPGVRSIASAIENSSSDGSDDGANDSGSKSSDNDSNTGEVATEKVNTEEVVVEKPDVEEPDASELENKDGTIEEEDGVHASPDLTTKDVWTAGELLTEFKGGLLTRGGRKEKRPSFWDLKPRLPVSQNLIRTLCGMVLVCHSIPVLISISFSCTKMNNNLARTHSHDSQC